jgi:N-acylneuraminate cytidylyltransferase
MIPCIIPARGGSKGIPHKNVVPLTGKPLIVWSIEQAQEARCVGTVCVATDAEEIATVAEAHGASVFWRSEESARDDAPSERVLKEVIEAWFAEASAVVFLQATSPVRRRGEIDKAYEQFVSSGADSLFSACRVHGYTWEMYGHHIVSGYQERRPRQLEPVERWEENGSIYIFKPEVLRRYGTRLGGRIAVHSMPRLASFQVDELGDVELIERVMELNHADSHAASGA